MNISIVGRLCSEIGFGICNDILVFFLKELIDFSISQYETAKKVFLKSKSMPNQYFKRFLGPFHWTHIVFQAAVSTHCV
jgi:hypothetical protein